MMKKYILYIVLCLALASGLQAQPYTTPKRELRAAWVSTVYGIDWPNAGASPARQRAALTRIVDSLARNNFNAVCFQVRSMSDAMYRSAYEPWSSYLTGTRGKDPGYDPLAYCVSECHRLGLECWAWINPYRFSTGALWSTSQDMEARQHLLSWGKKKILDPAQQWTVDRIVDVCRDVVTHYDIDGVIYDDYFYPDNIPTTSAAGDYGEWKASGTQLSLADWRRANVNRMVKAVYQMIQAEKPYVRFGISPAGVACTDADLAASYGIDPCPSGSDWQYGTIFSDPVSWLKEHDLDFVSPQVYWKRGFKRADFSLIAPWWCKVAPTMGRQVYISSSIERLALASEFAEYAAQVQLTRDSSPEGAGGTIFWSVTNLYRRSGLARQLCSYLRSTVYRYPALLPQLPWRNHKAARELKVETPVRGNGQLLWHPVEGVRYTVYAVPAGVSESQWQGQVQYLLGMAYNPDDAADDVVYDLPRDKQQGYKWAVCVLDRYGNEYAPVWVH